MSKIFPPFFHLDGSSTATDIEGEEQDGIELPGEIEERNRDPVEQEEVAGPRRWRRKKKKETKRKSSDQDKSQVIINFDKSLPATHSVCIQNQLHAIQLNFNCHKLKL